MNHLSLLDCTLRDGGYVNNWKFTQAQIQKAVSSLTDTGIDFIEMGYLTSITSAVGGTQFESVSAITKYIPDKHSGTKYLAMADVALFDVSALEQRSPHTIDCIRVVFYKRQIEQAFRFCEGVISKGYDLFIQPMVTMDYTYEEYGDLVKRFSDEYPVYSVSVVDSFGCMTDKDIIQYVGILDNSLPAQAKIGFHGHNNMNLVMQNALSFIGCSNNRDVIIDSSVNGIGRGAGNLCTELIADYYNKRFDNKYDINAIINAMSEVTQPISKEKKWGYTPYYMLTAKYQAHPNFADFMLAEHDVTVSEFNAILRTIPKDMLTRCTRPYVEELYQKFTGQ